MHYGLSEANFKRVFLQQHMNHIYYQWFDRVNNSGMIITVISSQPLCVLARLPLCLWETTVWGERPLILGISKSVCSLYNETSHLRYLCILGLLVPPPSPPSIHLWPTQHCFYWGIRCWEVYRRALKFTDGFTAGSVCWCETTNIPLKTVSPLSRTRFIYETVSFYAYCGSASFSVNLITTV